MKCRGWMNWGTSTRQWMLNLTPDTGKMTNTLVLLLQQTGQGKNEQQNKVKQTNHDYKVKHVQQTFHSTSRFLSDVYMCITNYANNNGILLIPRVRYINHVLPQYSFKKTLSWNWYKKLSSTYIHCSSQTLAFKLNSKREFQLMNTSI